MAIQEKLAQNSKNDDFAVLQDLLELHEESLDSLLERVKALGVQIKGSEDKASIIEVLVEALMNNEASGGTTMASQEPNSGILIALHSRDEQAKALIRQANERITMNQHMSPPRLFRLLLRNKDGELYSRTVPGVRLSKERLPAVLRIVVLPPDESQNKILEDFKASPEHYEQPVLVRVARRNKDGSVRSYVMLYLQRKSTGTSEQVF